MGYLHDFAFSFRVQRDVLVVDWRIGGLQLLLRMAILAYVFWSMSSSFMYLEQSKPDITVQGWVQQGTFYSGQEQPMKTNGWDEAGNAVPGGDGFDVSDPHYCNSPFTDDYKYTDGFDGESYTYPDIKCVRMPSSEVLPMTVTVTVTSRSLNLSQSLTARW
jgi:hypothetical protein